MQFIKVLQESDIPENLIESPVGDFLRYHNLKMPFKQYLSAELLIAMCMDNRKQLTIPENFAFIIRTGGANLRYSEFKVSYSIAIGKVKQILLLSHNNCGMVNLMSKKEQFVLGMMESAKWDRQKAEEHFMNYAPMYEIDNEIDFAVDESIRLMNKYKGILVVPAYYKIEDNLVYLLKRDKG